MGAYITFTNSTWIWNLDTFRSVDTHPSRDLNTLHDT